MRTHHGRVLALSVEPPEVSRKVVEDDGLDFSILADVQRTALRAYGLLHAGGGLEGEDIAIPAQILVRQDGTIAWSHVARRITDRAFPRRTIAAIEKL